MYPKIGHDPVTIAAGLLNKSPLKVIFMQLDYTQALQILKRSTILYKQHDLSQRIKELAAEIEQTIEGEIPLFLTVMNGGMFFAAELLKQIKAPFISDYIHASRYGNATSGATQLTWYRQPKIEDVQGRVVYILDDILDEGHTLAEITSFLHQAGAKACKMVVLIDKNLDKAKPITADHVGLVAPNFFLFGFGMDIYGLYRQLPDIYIYNS